MEQKITALKVQKKNPNRVNVYLDGEFAFGLSRIVAAWLQVGQTLSQDKIAELQAKDAVEVAFQRALKFLNYRERSEAEVIQNLKGHQIPENVIAEVIERLRRSGLIDDQRFAKNWIENRNEFRPRSRRALTYELRQKGIAQETIQEVVESVDEHQLAYRAASKVARKFKKAEWPVFRQKMLAHLARRGFDYETAAEVIRRVWAEQQALDTQNEKIHSEEVNP